MSDALLLWGYLCVRVTAEARAVLHVSLIPNPSHLEAADPVAVGKARAKQRILNDGSRKKVALSCSLSLRLPFDLAQVVSLIVHGDASAAGQGVVSETLLLANLEGYTVGTTPPSSLSLSLSLSLFMCVCLCRS
jgi:2-oxoglutarate dehydrogenase complex dehydrogenase (E1) component-like enzyme